MNETVLEQSIETRPLSKSISKQIYFIIKRLFDIFGAIIGCIILLPITLIVKISTILTGDFHSIFYKQKRIGKNGESIYIYKFRSMVCNADEVLKELLKDPKYKKEWDLNQKFENDPRITKMGNILISLSIQHLQDSNLHNLVLETSSLPIEIRY